MNFTEKHAAMLALVQKMHAGQVRSGDVPVWHHLARVSHLLEQVLVETKEGTQAMNETIILAALAHDSLEDTKVEKKQIVEIAGEFGLSLVEGMTNSFGDGHPAPYVAQVAAAPEPVRLIKLSDLYDNCTSVIYDLAFLGVKWTEEYFLPIVRPMIAAVLPTAFAEYPATAERMKKMVAASYDTLLLEFGRFKDAGRT